VGLVVTATKKSFGDFEFFCFPVSDIGQIFM
jgi:hypothetical protein